MPDSPYGRPTFTIHTLPLASGSSMYKVSRVMPKETAPLNLPWIAW